MPDSDLSALAAPCQIDGCHYAKWRAAESRLAEVTEALRLYRYAVDFANAEAWDRGADMMERFRVAEDRAEALGITQPAPGEGFVLYRAAAATPAPPVEDRPCTCHPDDRPPGECRRKFAASECRSTPATPPSREMGEDDVERVARALCAARGQDPDGYTGFVATSNPAKRTKNWEAARGEARAALSAMPRTQEKK